MNHPENVREDMKTLSSCLFTYLFIEYQNQFKKIDGKIIYRAVVFDLSDISMHTFSYFVSQTGMH